MCIMKKWFVVLMIFCAFIADAQKTQVAQKKQNFVLVIHGGAGTISRQYISAEKEKAYTESLQKALQAGYAILEKGGSALDAVEAAVRLMEDDSLFNAGKGAVFTNDGRVELDAAIMDGSNLKAGSVAGVTIIKNPITAARAVMEKTEHVMLIGKGAEQFASGQALDIVDPSYFYTDGRWKSLQKAKQQDSIKISAEKKTTIMQRDNHDEKYGTVGAVALDKKGNLAAATSTGGMSNKKFGRVGDVPIIGAGTYANNASCAVSCTGWGEFFIRLVVAKSVSDLMEYKNYPLQKAADEMIMKKVPQLGGDGGLIAVDRNGNITMPFNTSGMFRGYIKSDGKPVVRMYQYQ